jgi:hypothetical protein
MKSFKEFRQLMASEAGRAFDNAIMGKTDELMDSDHEHHLQEVKDSFEQEVDKKYRHGQLEHGGNLWQKSGLIKQAKQEAVDLYVYLDTLEKQLERLTGETEEL